MTKMDVYGMTHKLDDTLLDVMIARLEARGNHSFFVKMLHEYLDEMDIDSAKTVLDMGCGTGVAARQIAQRMSFSGNVVGIDISPYLVQAAAQLAEEEGLSDRVEFQSGDTHSLELQDNTFDAVVAHTLVSHVDDPFAVVNEAARVVKPGGIVAVFDGDYASLTFGQADPGKGREDDEALINALVANPRVMRQMPRLLAEAGLKLIATFPYVLAEVGKAEFWVSGIESFRKLVPKAGLMSQEYADDWATGLFEDSERGVFFGASNYYSYIARCK